MAVTSAEEFFAVLEKSKLLIPSQLALARAAAGPNDSPRAIAKSLARQEFITRWQAGQLLAGRSSFYLGKYRLIELLGRGGKGSVFLGQHVTMNRRVALKIIAREVSNNPAALKRFLADARAIAALDHPNIVRVYSVDNEGDRYYLVMEHVEGAALQRLVEEDGPLDCHRAADYIRQAADGLDHAHQQNMIHGSIQPSKLLVNRQGAIKIIDMGLAWLGEGDRSAPVDEDRQELGTVDYVAPEQTLQSVLPDGRADIYSLGCALYFVLTGHAPFARGALSERTLKHPTQELPDICIERPKVPPELAAICRRMAATKPEDRFQTAAEVSRELAQWRASAPIEQVMRLPRAKPL
jgi:eukaryotic-like serine/threonine-protein kinase